MYSFVKWSNSTNPNIWIDLKYPNPLSVPLKFTIEGLDRVLHVKIYNLNNFAIQSVQLISPPNSIISTNGNFNENQSKPSEPNIKEYMLPIEAFHFDEISNKTYNYNLSVDYVEGPNKAFKQVTIPFAWTIIMKDLPWLNYLWIVMAGVVASRFITFIADTKRTNLLILTEQNHYGLHSLS